MAKFAELTAEQDEYAVKRAFLDPFIDIIVNSSGASTEIEQRDIIEAGLEDLNYNIQNEEDAYRLPPHILERCEKIIEGVEKLDDASIREFIANIHRSEIKKIDDLESIVTECIKDAESEYEDWGSDPSSYGEEDEYSPEALPSHVEETEYQDRCMVSMRSAAYVKPVKGIMKGSGKAKKSHISFDKKPSFDPLDKDNIEKVMAAGEGGPEAVVDLIRSYKGMGFKVGGEYSKKREDDKIREYPHTFKHHYSIDYLESLLPDEYRIPVYATKPPMAQERFDLKISCSPAMCAESDVLKIISFTPPAHGYGIWVRGDFEHTICTTIPIVGASDELG